MGSEEGEGETRSHARADGWPLLALQHPSGRTRRSAPAARCSPGETCRGAHRPRACLRVVVRFETLNKSGISFPSHFAFLVLCEMWLFPASCQ